MTDEDNEPDLDEALVGRTIANKFLLKRLLGAGGMGAVYEAEDMLLKRRVALKLMKAAVARNKGFVQRFIREGRAANSIEHPNIVRVLDLAVEEDSGSLFIVQELLSGESLADRLSRDKRLSVAEAVALLDPVLEALQHAHSRGIIHRDIKPDNVFLHRDASGAVIPKIIDFGISKVTEEQQEGLTKTQTGTALGTPYYMSPEQIRGDSNIDSRADLWSAAVMGFEMMTGQRPFNGDNYNMLIINIITSPPPDATTVEPSVPSSVSDVLKRSLKMNRDERYPTARELRDALDEAVLMSGSRVTNVIPLSPSIRPASPIAAPVSTGPAFTADSLASMTIAPEAVTRVAPEKKRSMLPLIAGGALALLGAVGFGATKLSSSATPNTAPVSATAPREAIVVAPSPAVSPAIAPTVAQPTPTPAVVAAGPANAPAPVAATRGSRTRVATGQPSSTVAPSVEAVVAPVVAPVVAAVAPVATPPVAEPPARPEPQPAVAQSPAAPPERPAAEPSAEPAANPASAEPAAAGTAPAGRRRFRFVTNYPQ
jgi:serine/threonine protein kinase